MKYLFVLIFLIFFIVFDKSIGYTNVSPLWTHFTYMFQHANLIHLVINSLAFIGMFRVLEKEFNKYKLAASIFIIGFAVSFLSAHELPTVGVSGVIYAMVGIYLAMILIKRIIVKDRNKLYIFIVSIILCLTVSFFNPNSNYGLHFLCLVLSFSIFVWIEIFKPKKDFIMIDERCIPKGIEPSEYVKEIININNKN